MRFINPETDDVLYRYEETYYSLGCDEYGDPYPGHTIKVHLNYYKVLKRTPKGAWIEYWKNPNGKKFVNLTARKKFACDNEEDAKESFIARKNRQIKILKSQLKNAREALAIMQDYVKEKPPSEDRGLGDLT